jgi:hypothetical protein
VPGQAGDRPAAFWQLQQLDPHARPAGVSGFVLGRTISRPCAQDAVP